MEFKSLKRYKLREKVMCYCRERDENIAYPHIKSFRVKKILELIDSLLYLEQQDGIL